MGDNDYILVELAFDEHGNIKCDSARALNKAVLMKKQGLATMVIAIHVHAQASKCAKYTDQQITAAIGNTQVGEDFVHVKVVPSMTGCQAKKEVDSLGYSWKKPIFKYTCTAHSTGWF